MPNQNKKQELLDLLKLHYGFKGFWPGQEKAIDNILKEKSSVVIMPTGGGKSLIYRYQWLPPDQESSRAFLLCPDTYQH